MEHSHDVMLAVLVRLRREQYQTFQHNSLRLPQQTKNMSHLLKTLEDGTGQMTQAKHAMASALLNSAVEIRTSAARTYYEICGQEASNVYPAVIEAFGRTTLTAEILEYHTHLKPLLLVVGRENAILIDILETILRNYHVPVIVTK